MKPIIIGAPKRPRTLLRRIARGLMWLAFALLVLAVAYPLAARRFVLRWGATDAEAEARLPGDELLPVATVQATRAITIRAPVESVWPWLLQLGQGRGGFYSYEALENLFGCDIHNADRIVPELQGLKVGDEVRLVPDPYVFLGQRLERGPRYWVASIEPNRALALRIPRAGAEPAPGEPKAASSWTFVLDRVDARTTRLVVRSRGWSDPPWLAPLIGVEPMHFVMEERMLRGIRDRAEALAARGD